MAARNVAACVAPRPQGLPMLLSVKGERDDVMCAFLCPSSKACWTVRKMGNVLEGHSES